MSDLYKVLQKKEQELQELLQRIKDLQKDLPDGSLQVSKIQEQYRYYYYPPTDRQTQRTIGTKNSTRQKRHYIHTDNQDLIRRLAEKEYLQEMYEQTSSQLFDIHNLLVRYDPDSLNHVQEKLHPAKQKLITPLCIPLAQYIEEWTAQSYESNPTPFTNAEYYTEKGHRVRSKSEMIIADRLFRQNIPYRYEAPLLLPNGVIIYPDFTILNPRTREICYWEHFGMMQDPEYAANFQLKFDTFNSIGILPGKNLILTFESSERPLNVKTVMRSIDEYLI